MHNYVQLLRGWEEGRGGGVEGWEEGRGGGVGIMEGEEELEAESSMP